jgi:hypothetical protein
LARALTDENATVDIVLSSCNPAPYQGTLAVISIERCSGGEFIKISRHGETLVVRGSSEKLAILAENIRFLLAQGSDPQNSIQNHIHVEYYHDHPYLDRGAVPLTIDYLDH